MQESPISTTIANNPPPQPKNPYQITSAPNHPPPLPKPPNGYLSPPAITIPPPWLPQTLTSISEPKNPISEPKPQIQFRINGGWTLTFNFSQRLETTSSRPMSPSPIITSAATLKSQRKGGGFLKSQIGRKVRERERDDKCDRERGEVFQSPEREREREIPGGLVRSIGAAW